MAEIYPRLSEAKLDALPSRAEAKVYRQLRDMAFPGLKVMHGLSTTPLDQLKKQTGSLLQAMDKVIPGITLPIAPVLVFPDNREWQGELPALALNREHLLLKGT
ncbi:MULTISPECIES: hypothetical protein [Halomonas]|uniref:Uncharacterized protein n=1 Tax=Halomonas ventosae TaxID=229007 RepID=A0A4R6HCA5_9GAMM|nr:hypothetical protein [Halomonas ventosae]TDO06080.1 hypothetical protein DFO68_11390 [Halomonas ventosae]